MALKTHMALFVERFATYNLDRYANNPIMRPRFIGLRENEITVTEIRHLEDERRTSTVSSFARNFYGIEQDWYPADAATDLELYRLKNVTPLADWTAVLDQEQPGIYSYLKAGVPTVAVVIPYETPDAGISVTAEAVVRAYINYDIPTVYVETNSLVVTCVGETWNGKVAWARGKRSIRIIPPTDYGVLGEPYPR